MDYRYKHYMQTASSRTPSRVMEKQHQRKVVDRGQAGKGPSYCQSGIQHQLDIAKQQLVAANGSPNSSHAVKLKPRPSLFQQLSRALLHISASTDPRWLRHGWVVWGVAKEDGGL